MYSRLASNSQISTRLCLPGIKIKGVCHHIHNGAGELTQRLRALAALARDRDLDPSIHIEAHRSL